MKNVFFKMMVVGMTSGVFVGCADSIEDLYDPAYAKMKQQYQSQWEQQFGDIDPNHTWGFGEEESRATRYALTSKNDWDSYEVPADPDETEIEKVMNVFSQPIDSSMVVEQIKLSEFFVQYIGKGYDTLTTWADQNGVISKTVGSSKMDQLRVQYTDANGVLCDEHVNNFNADQGRTMLMLQSGTERFGYFNSLDQKYHYESIILKIDDAYYVGFDFYSFFSDQEQGKGYMYGSQNVDADGIYNDWVVKIVPAVYKETKRIVCEDLGTIGDFDFNDVVFDAYMVDDDEAVVTVLAAGGTLPIYVGDVEVHAAMGVETNVMINTGGNSVTAPLANFRVATTSIKDIPVRVLGNDAVYVLQAAEGQAPQKICVPTTFQWCVERANIKDAYPAFEAWSQSEDENAEWYNNVNTEYLK